MFPHGSNVKPSEPNVFAATSADAGPVLPTLVGSYPNIVAAVGLLLAPSHSKPLVCTSV